MSALPVPPDHPVKEMLELSIIPYIISAKKLKWQPFYLANSINVYSRDILVGLIGVGLSTPVMEVVSKALGSQSEGNVGVSNTQSLWSQIQPGWRVVVIIAVVLSVCLRVFVNRSKADERAILAKTCGDEIRQASINLISALNQSNPIDELTIMRNKIIQIANNKAWPWDYDTAPGIGPEVEARVGALSARFGHRWTMQESVQQEAATTPPSPGSAPILQPPVVST